MAIKINTVKAGDELYYPLSTRPGEYYVIQVVSVDHEAGTAVINLNGHKSTVNQRNFNRYRRSPPKKRGI